MTPHGPMIDFEIYRSKHNLDHFVAIEVGSTHARAEAVRNSHAMEMFDIINADDPRPAMGFDRTRAHASVVAHGFFAFSLVIVAREHFE